MAKTNKSAPKPTAAPKPAPVTTKWQVAKTAKPKFEDSKSANEVVPPHRNQSPLEGISDLGVNICLPSETLLSPVQAFSLAFYVCHHTEWITPGGSRAVLVHQDIVHHAVSILGLTHLEATAIYVMMAGRAVKILVACLLVSEVDNQP